MCKPLSADSTSTVTRSRTPASCMSAMCLRPKISVKLPAISMRAVQKNPDQLTIEDLPTIRSQVPVTIAGQRWITERVHTVLSAASGAQVQKACHSFYSQQQKRSKQSVSTFADMSHIPQSLQLPFLLILTAYNVKPVNIPHHLQLHLAQQQPWLQDQHLSTSIALD